MSWITPIIDRTQTDVDYAKANQNSSSDLKGAWNISDVNRIIDNTIYLRDILKNYNYDVGFDNQSHVTESDFPYILSFMKILKDNVNSVVNCFYKYNNPTINYSNTFNFNDANNIEINLNITNTLLENMINELLYSGEPYCSDTITL